MTDRELLEAAAEAAGIRYDPEASKPHPKSGAWFGLWLLIDGEPNDLTRRRWNPLADDGDAFRLAVKLGIQIRQYPIYDTPRFAAYACEPKWDSDAQKNIGAEALVQYDGDQYAATRRAIVRAAAALTRKESKE